MSFTICFFFGSLVTILLTVAAYVEIMPESKVERLGSFGHFLHDLFHFKKLYIEAVLRFCYVLSTSACVAYGFFLLFAKQASSYSIYRDNATVRFWYIGLFVLLIGPVLARLLFEIVLLRVIEVQNILEINHKINGKAAQDLFVDGTELTERFAELTERTILRKKQEENPAQPDPEEETTDKENQDPEEKGT